MQLSLINPYIRAALESRISGGHNIARRVIFDYELIYIEEGRLTLVYNDKSYRCVKGDIIFIHPGVSHSFIIDSGEISQPHVHFDITCRPQSDSIPISFKDKSAMTKEEISLIHKDYFGGDASPIVTVQDKDDFLECFYSVIRDKSSPVLRKARMIKLLSAVIEDNFADSEQEQPLVNVAQQIKDYLDAGNGLCMSLDDFGKTFFASKFNLERSFKKAFGTGIIEYRNERRMLLANTLLRDNSVSKTAEILGYRSIYSFSRAYKQHYGVPPREYAIYTFGDDIHADA